MTIVVRTALRRKFQAASRPSGGAPQPDAYEAAGAAVLVERLRQKPALLLWWG